MRHMILCTCTYLHLSAVQVINDAWLLISSYSALSCCLLQFSFPAGDLLCSTNRRVGCPSRVHCGRFQLHRRNRLPEAMCWHVLCEYNPLFLGRQDCSSLACAKVLFRRKYTEGFANREEVDRNRMVWKPFSLLSMVFWCMSLVLRNRAWVRLRGPNMCPYWMVCRPADLRGNVILPTQHSCCRGVRLDRSLSVG